MPMSERTGVKMKNYVSLGFRWLIQFVVLVVCGIIFVNLMNKIDIFYLTSRSNNIVYALLYATGVISVQLSILCYKLKNQNQQ